MSRSKEYSNLAENESALGNPERNEKQVEITGDGVNVRSTLDAASRRLGIVRDGEKFNYIETKDGWYKIDFNGKDGWVSGRHSRIVG